MSHVSQPHTSVKDRIKRALPPRRYRDLERVQLVEDVPEHDLKRGEEGTIVHVFETANAYLVEFVNEDGSTRADPELTPRQIRPA